MSDRESVMSLPRLKVSPPVIPNTFTGTSCSWAWRFRWSSWFGREGDHYPGLLFSEKGGLPACRHFEVRTEADAAGDGTFCQRDGEASVRAVVGGHDDSIPDGRADESLSSCLQGQVDSWLAGGVQPSRLAYSLPDRLESLAERRPAPRRTTTWPSSLNSWVTWWVTSSRRPKAPTTGVG